MKKLLVGAVVLLAGLIATAEEKFSYKCILNTPEVPRFNFERTFPKQQRDAILRAPFAGYVVLKARAKAGEMVRPVAIISSEPKGTFDRMAAAFVEQMRFHGFTTGSHIAAPPELRIHVLFYTMTKPKYVIGVADLATDYVKAVELTPALVSYLIQEGQNLPPLPSIAGR